jgi:DHA1 family multidrug resistance protein-like MFS transporter
MLDVYSKSPFRFVFIHELLDRRRDSYSIMLRICRKVVAYTVYPRNFIQNKHAVGISVGSVRNLSHRDKLRIELTKTLQIVDYKEEEIHRSYEMLKNPSGSLVVPTSGSSETIDITSGLKAIFPADKVVALQDELLGKPKPGEVLAFMTYEDYRDRVITMGERLDFRVYPLAAAFLCTGISVGVIIPAMPMLVHDLGISPVAFGFVVAAFGLSRLLGNLPAGQLVDRFGRKPVLLAGLSVTGLGLAGISLTFIPTLGEPWLLLCRFVSGLGVAAFTSAGFMVLADISTPLNRTRTIAPVMAAFSGGTALGPALGGLLIPTLGLPMTYVVAGSSFAFIATLCSFLIEESRPTFPTTAVASTTSNQTQAEQPARPPQSIADAIKTWGVLLRDHTNLRRAVIFSGGSWIATAGTQFTLLPLHMASPALGLAPLEVGMCFAASSAISFLAAQPVAMLADSIGKERVLLLGGVMLTSSAFLLPHAENLVQMFLLALPMALGSSALNAVPPALVTDLAPSTTRVQALSLLRTAGDMGLLLGASTAGLVAANMSLETAAYCDGGLMAMVVLGYLFATKGRTTSSTIPRHHSKSH